MKYKLSLITVIILLLFSNSTIASSKDSTQLFEESFKELKSMLEGNTEADFERAVYLSEAPYWDNGYSYKQFREMIDDRLIRIKILADANSLADIMNFSVKVGSNGRFRMEDLEYTESEKRELYENALKNWAIFTFITDTTSFLSDTHYPYSYSTHDPFGIKDWKTSQVINLIGTPEKTGNCYALTALFKILSNRLNSKATICTAPQHIYIQHRDKIGGLYNVELATAGHPSDGQLKTLTHSSSDAVRNAIALRSYDEKQSIGLLLINLAKSYERKFNIKSDGFLIKCAETAIAFDPKNLNALLLKQQVLDEQVFHFVNDKIQNIESLKKISGVSEIFNDLENNTKLLYTLGYRPMPINMQKVILDGFSNKEEARLFYLKDKNPSPYTTIKPLKEEDSEYVTLSGGLFKEVWSENETEIFGHFVFETSSKSIVGIETDNFQQSLIDPVAFAYDFGSRMYDSRTGRWMSRDPQAKRQPGWSPYKAFLDNPILYVDPDGETEYITIITNNEKTGETNIEVSKSNKIMTDGIKHAKYQHGDTEIPENYYYDYATTTLRTVGVNGSVTETTSTDILYSKGIQDRELVVFGGDAMGDTKTPGLGEDTWGHGGLLIYGSARSGEGTVGAKSTGMPWGSFDFGEFSEIMGLVNTSMQSKSDNTLSTEFNGIELTSLVDDAKGIVEYNNSQRGNVRSGFDTKYTCPTCNGDFGSGDTAAHNKKLNRKSGPFTPAKK